MQNTLRKLEPEKPWKSMAVHALRVAIFVGIVSCIHLEARKHRLLSSQTTGAAIPSEIALSFFPQEARVGEPADRLVPINDNQGKLLGYVAQTSPDADHIVGFSGPTTIAIAFDEELNVAGLDVIGSHDTREHVAEVVQNDSFWNQFVGQPWDDIQRKSSVDTVSGATLTSLAIGQSIIHRLGGQTPALKFPNPLQLEEVQELIPDANSMTASEAITSGWDIWDQKQNLLGMVISTSPAADALSGYQGPSETLILFDPDRRATRIHLRSSYDNEPYVSYLNDDWSWPTLFEGLSINEIGSFNLEAEGIEGVSGATFTSMAVARGVIASAKQALLPAPVPANPETPWSLTFADLGTLAMILAGITIATTHLRGIAWIRISFQVLLVTYIGLINGDMLSQAMLVGWVQNGVPWRTASRLVVLSGVAFAYPILTKKNVYCTHLCPHGAIQQLLKRRVTIQYHPTGTLKRALTLLPTALLIWVLCVAMFHLGFSLVDIEAFDAYLVRIAGWSAITIAVIGLAASLFVPMAYCRFGCPTGHLLDYFRRNRKSSQISYQDVLAASLLALSIFILLY